MINIIKRELLILICVVMQIFLSVGFCQTDTTEKRKSTHYEPIEANVKMINGYPRLFINDTKVEPIMPFVNTDIAQSNPVSMRQIKLAAEYGDIHLHHVIISMPPSVTKGVYNFAILKTAIDLVKEADPKGYVILRISLADWYDSRMYDKGDQVTYTNGIKGDMISMASDKWLRNAEEKLKAIINYVLNDPVYSKMVVGYHLTAGQTGEWFQYLYRQYGVDISKVNTVKFRNWLVSKYGTAEKLNDAWGSKDVDFGRVSIPPELGEGYGDNQRTLYDEKADQRILDYLDYYNQMTSERIITLAKTVKDATDRKSLVGAFYGYTFELPDAKSGHYNLSRVLYCPDIDFLDGPISYNNRNEGGVGASMSLVESIHVHGKMWFDECDYRSPIQTFDSGPRKNHMPFIKSYEGLIEVYRRQLGFQMLRGTGCWAMDLLGQGWYDHAGFWREMKSLKKMYAKYEKIRPKKSPEIALIVDEKGLALASDVRFNRHMLLHLRDELYKTGVNFGVYLRNDLENGLVPPAKIYIMVGTFRMEADALKRLDSQLKQPDKTVVWLYGFGTISSEGIKDLTGMNIYKTNKSLVPEITASANLKNILPDVKSAIFGSGIKKKSPLWAVRPDKELTVLGKTFNEISFAMNYVNGSRQIFYGSNVLKADMIRALARLAGANIFISGGWDTCMANSNLLVVHSSDEGERKIHFPRKVDVYEQYSKKWYHGVDKIELKDVSVGKTYMFYYGDKQALEKVGIGILNE